MRNKCSLTALRIVGGRPHSSHSQPMSPEANVMEERNSSKLGVSAMVGMIMMKNIIIVRSLLEEEEWFSFAW